MNEWISRGGWNPTRMPFFRTLKPPTCENHIFPHLVFPQSGMYQLQFDSLLIDSVVFSMLKISSHFYEDQLIFWMWAKRMDSLLMSETIKFLVSRLCMDWLTFHSLSFEVWLWCIFHLFLNNDLGECMSMKTILLFGSEWINLICWTISYCEFPQVWKFATRCLHLEFEK